VLFSVSKMTEAKLKVRMATGTPQCTRLLVADQVPMKSRPAILNQVNWWPGGAVVWLSPEKEKVM
jgi:hypothetical protein